MNLETAKTQWQQIDPEHAARWTRENLKLSWAHPSLSYLRRQLLLECACWTAFFVVYYTVYDGPRVSVAWSVALGGGLLLLIGHGLLGYRLAGQAIGDRPVIEALGLQLRKLRTYSYWSMTLRTLTLTTFVGFLLTRIPDLGSNFGIWALSTALIWIAVSLVIQHLLWRGHFRELKKTLLDLTN